MKRMHMDLTALHLNQLFLVDALLSNTNLSEAAEQIGMSQSAASHALGRLRKQLGDPIFIRTAEGMQPTPYGTRLARHVREALHLLRDGLERHADFEPQASERTFNIIMSDVSQTLYLPKLLARLSREAPGVTLRITPVPTKAPHLILESGEVDLAVGTFTRIIAGCRQKRLYKEKYVCVARRDHPLVGDGMSTQAFCSVAHVLVDSKGYVHEQLDRILSQQEVPRKAKLQVPGFQSVPLVVARSDLVAIMASRLASVYAELLPLAIMPPPVILPSYDVKVFWHERFHRDATNAWLRGLFFELFGD
jgi:DNA-binding transcriptional LysR family regulator